MKIEILKEESPFKSGGIRVQAQWMHDGILQTVQSAVIDASEHPMHVAGILIDMGETIHKKHEKNINPSAATSKAGA